MSILDNEGHDPNGVLNTPNYSHPCATPAAPRAATERDDKDYAIEFGEYLAKAAEAFMKFMNDTGVRINNPELQDSMTDHWRGLQLRIYEFRKRATRASFGVAAATEALDRPGLSLEIWRSSSHLEERHYFLKDERNTYYFGFNPQLLSENDPRIIALLAPPNK